jgi:selenocysteine-specific elongation factor
LIARTGWTAKEVTAAAAAPVRVIGHGALLIDESRFHTARERLVAAVSAYHKANPLQAGAAKAELRGREFAAAPLEVFEELLSASPEVVAEGESVRLKAHRVALKEDEEKARAAIEGAFAKAGLAAPAVKEVLAQSGVEAARAKTLLQTLLREGKLAKIDNELVFHSQAITGLRALLAKRKGERFDVGAFKDWTGVSRKYAIPLLEYLDRERVTRREGDGRVVL